MLTRLQATIAISIALVAGTVVCYREVLFAGFVCYDDPRYVYQNDNVLGGLSWRGWYYAWTSWDCSNWHPLTWLSLELDASLWGRNPMGYHATNLLIHCFNVVLVFAVLRQMTTSVFRSASVAAIFAIHPLHVESVAWVAERKDVLSAFFLFLTTAAYARYANRPSYGKYFAVLLLFSLGLLAKPMLVTLPFLLILLDYWPLRRVAIKHSHVANVVIAQTSIQTIIFEKIPMVVIASADGIMTVVAQKESSQYLNDVSFDARVANAFHAYLWYLQKTFIPTNLIVFYPHPEQNFSAIAVGAGVLVVVGISLWVAHRMNEKPHLCVGWLWFLISLLPVIGILQVGGQAYADRYSYIPHVGLFVAIIWELHSLSSATRLGRTLATVSLLATLLTFGFLTRSQTAYWNSSIALWQHAIDVDPENYIAHGHLADLRYLEGDFDRTIEHIRISLRSKRTDNLGDVYSNWGACLVGLNRQDEAKEKFLAAIEFAPYKEGALSEVVRILHAQGRKEEAVPFTHRIAMIEREKQLVVQAMQTPDTESAQLIFGEWHLHQNRFAQAILHFQNATRLSPQSAAAYHKLAMAQVRLRLFKEAKSNFIRALERNPLLGAAHLSLAQILETENDLAGAKKHFAEAIHLNPLDGEAKKHLDRLSNL